MQFSISATLFLYDKLRIKNLEVCLVKYSYLFQFFN